MHVAMMPWCHGNVITITRSIRQVEQLLSSWIVHMNWNEMKCKIALVDPALRTGQTVHLIRHTRCERCDIANFVWKSLGLTNDPNQCDVPNGFLEGDYFSILTISVCDFSNYFHVIIIIVQLNKWHTAWAAIALECNMKEKLARPKCIRRIDWIQFESKVVHNH